MILNHAVEPKTYCMKQARILTPTSNSNWRSIRLLSQTWIFSSEFFSRLVDERVRKVDFVSAKALGIQCYTRIRNHTRCQYRKVVPNFSSSTSVTKIKGWHSISVTLMLTSSSWWQYSLGPLLNVLLSNVMEKGNLIWRHASDIGPTLIVINFDIPLFMATYVEPE